MSNRDLHLSSWNTPWDLGPDSQAGLGEGGKKIRDGCEMAWVGQESKMG